MKVLKIERTSSDKAEYLEAISKHEDDRESTQTTESNQNG